MARNTRIAVLGAALVVALWGRTVLAAPPAQDDRPAPPPRDEPAVLPVEAPQNASDVPDVQGSAGAAGVLESTPSTSSPATSAPVAMEAEGQPDASARQLVADFETRLAPYGVWREHRDYGRVWIPHVTIVGSNFEPYVSEGQWALNSQREWVWVSEHPFGPIVYHYGRWVWAADAGWMWIPGWRFAPSWVVWRTPRAGAAYLGWAPMPPHFIWVRGSVMWLHTPPPAAFVFCPSAYAFAPYPHRYLVRDRTVMRRLVRQTNYFRPFRRGAGIRTSPSLTAARVPAVAVPRYRVPARPRAVLPESPTTASPSSRTPPGTAMRRAVRPSVRYSPPLHPQPSAASGEPRSAPATRSPARLRPSGAPAGNWRERIERRRDVRPAPPPAVRPPRGHRGSSGAGAAPRNTARPRSVAPRR